jgi:hypothetical protein
MGGIGRGVRVRFAYADPPYLGCCSLYDHYHPDGRCWDDLHTHKGLIGWLTTGYPDGWALSLSSPSLQQILPLCPNDVRVGAWVKPFHAYKKGVRPAYSWEPVIYRGGHNPPWEFHPPPEKDGEATTPKDFHSANITLEKGLTGAKPPSFCSWVLDLLNVRPDDIVDDLYPGTGVMADAIAAPSLFRSFPMAMLISEDPDLLDLSAEAGDPPDQCATTDALGFRCGLLTGHTEQHQYGPLPASAEAGDTDA